MTNSKNTKRALLASVLSMMLCLAMLIGSTFAWFTDTVTSGKNKIIAGNLDVELEYSLTGEENSWVSVNEETNMFKDDALWEPGYTQVVYLRVANVGSLAFKYQFGINVAGKTLGKTADNKDIDLSNFIKFGVVETAEAFADRTTALNAVKDSAALISAGYSSGEGKLAVGGTSNMLALVVYMPEDVGNDANYRGEVAPSIDLGINLVATQDTVEEDSFGKDYDENAKYPDVAGGNDDWYVEGANSFTISTAAHLIDFAKRVNKGEAFANKTITLASDIALDGSANWIPIGTSDNPFKGTFDGAGHTVSGMMINRESTEDVGFFGTISGATITHLAVSGKVTVGTSALRDDIDYHVGGICAYAEENAAIEKCTNKVDVKVADNEIELEFPTIYVGGVVGAVDSGSISDCLNIGTITAIETYPAAYVGGITSIISGSEPAIANAVNVGAITGGVYTGGIIAGSIGGRNPVNSYSMNVVAVGTDTNAVPTTAEAMKLQSTFTGFDFNTVWELTNGQYPTLR